MALASAFAIHENTRRFTLTLSLHPPNATRTLIQIKSHAQKVLKREELGDDVFLPLKANKDKVDALLKDKSRLFQRDDPAASTLMSSDGRYHTIAMQEATTGNHGPHQQQQQRLLQTPLPPGCM